MITFREALETFLVVAVAISYLHRTECRSLRTAAWAGVAGGLAVSLPLGIWLSQRNLPLWDGTFAILMALLLGSFAVFLWRTVPPPLTALSRIAVFAVLLFVVAREGAGIAMDFVRISHTGFRVRMGVALVLALLFAWACASFLARLGRPGFAIATVVLVAFLAIQILFFGVHELSEAEVLPNSHTIHEATEPYSADGRYSLWTLLAIVGISAASAATAKEPTIA